MSFLTFYSLNNKFETRYRMKNNLLIRSTGYLFAFALFLLLDSCAVNPVTGKKELMLMSEDQEIALGQQSDPSIVASFGLYDDQQIQNFISTKGQQMAKVSHRPNLPYEFKVLDSPVVNAFALPGGYVYFTRGILAHFNNEAEFAGVLGHEIGHITARHGASQQSKAILAQVGLVVGLVASPEFAQFADVAQQGLGLLFLKFGRDDESQSDRLGAEYSTRIGYDAHYMADFFQTLGRLSAESGQSIPTFLSTHPDPADRYNKVHEHADKWQRELNASNLNVNRNSYLQMIDGLVYGEDPKQGFVENDNFYHPELKFQFPIPKNWQTANSPTQFQMAPADGNALMLLTLAQGSSLDEAMNASLEQYQLTLVESGNTQVNGYPTKTFIADQTNEQTQQTIRVQSYLIQYSGNIYQFLGVADRNNFNSYKNYFDLTMKGFRDLNDPDKLNRQPERIKVETVRSSGTLVSALRDFNMPSDRHEELAILNGMQLNDPVTQGMLIKVVGK